jgi:hypothetical protein
MTHFATLETPAKANLYTADGRIISTPCRVQRNAHGPGYEVMGTVYLPSGLKPSATVIAQALTPKLKPRWHPHYNGRVVYGYRTIRDAQDAARKYLNSDAPYVAR